MGMSEREQWWAEKHRAEQQAAMRMVDKAREREQELTNALREYGTHKQGCGYRGSGYPESCTCGFAALDPAVEESPDMTYEEAADFTFGPAAPAVEEQR